jgi:hypothetical protein
MVGFVGGFYQWIIINTTYDFMSRLLEAVT